MNSEIELEPFIDERGVLMVRCKDTKRLIKGVLDVNVSNGIESLPFQDINVKIQVITKRFKD